MIELTVNNMSCNHCVSMITKAIHQQQSDAQVEVDLATKMVRVQSLLSRDELLQVLDEAGYSATPRSETQ
ncbi:MULTISPECIES: heavy-metal-associated domain-containing protein [Rheinheimera]|uniref:Heavy-metal-associated domain-containing protein n=1 Tax=Rheinheimera marina TaxID=1774958 RepID=A0ABV9JNI4_9GAMM